MTLQKQNIPIIFTQGLDTKTDEKFVIPGKFLELENAVFRKGSRIEKRFGFTSLNPRILATTETITSGKKLTTYNNDLLLMNNTNIYAYSGANDAWINKGSFATVTVSNYPIVRNSATQTMPDVAQIDKLSICAWHDSRATSGTSLRYSILDDSTKSILKYDQEFVSGADVRLPKCVAVLDYLCVFGLQLVGAQMQLKMRRFNTVTLAEDNLTIATDVDTTDALYDISLLGNFIAVTFNNAAGGLSVLYVVPDYSGVPVVGTSLTGAPGKVDFASEQGDKALTLCVDSINQYLYVAFVTSANNVRVRAIRNDLIASTSSVVTVEGSMDAVNITGVVDSASKLVLFYQVKATLTPDTRVRTAKVSWTGGASTVAVQTAASGLKRSVGLATKAFLFNSVVYVNVVHDSTLQPTYFTLSSDGAIATKMLPGLGGGLTKIPAGTARSGLAQATLDSDGKVFFPLLTRNKLEADAGGTILASTGVVGALLDFGKPSFLTAQLGLNLHVAGGFLTNYDGVSATEHGFHIFPEGVTATGLTTGGSIAAGVYQYAAIYEWVDGSGQIHRSAPGLGTPVTTTGSTSSVELTIPTLRLTAKTGTRADVRVVIYRTKANGGIFYRVTDVQNNPEADSIGLTDVAIDATIAVKEILYTTGGVLENIAPPACRIVASHGNRIFLAGLEDRNSYWFSRESYSAEGVPFSDALQGRVNPEGGGITAMASLDDKLVFFKEDAIYYIAGDGPVDTGQQNTFTQPQRVSSDTGCKSPESIIKVPDGIMFKSDKGLRLLNRSLQVVDIGTSVEKYNALTITSAQIISDENEVRFTTSDGLCLIYNYYFNQWSTFTNYEAESAVIWQDAYLHLKSTGLVNKEVKNSYTDNGSNIALRAVTSWLQFAGVQGFQRIYWVSMLGNALSDHTLVTKVAYDFEDVYTETVLFDTAQQLSLEEFGDEAYFGQSTYFGGESASSYEFEFKPARQKCEAVKLSFEDLTTYTSGAAYSLNSLTVTVGVKQGTNKHTRRG